MKRLPRAGRLPLCHAGLAVLLACLLPRPVGAEFTFDATVPLPPEVEKTIERAQAWLASCQRKNGAWGNNGENGMALCALMVNGTTPGYGKYGTHVAKGIEYILSTQKPSGVLTVLGGDNVMYEHALATLALAEAYGMTHNPDIRPALIRAVNLIVETQHHTGGWRYPPQPVPGDLSVTVMQVMALRAAAEVGVYVPKETIEHAIAFIKSCWHEPSAGFGYRQSAETNFNRAGAGVVCLQSIGLYEDPVIPKAVETIFKKGLEAMKEPDRTHEHFWYGHYYASVALYHYGGDRWKEYYRKVCEMVMNDWQKTPAYWQHSTLPTSWAILTIGVPYRYLPIYQR